MTGELGTIYLLHFEPPYKHARHYYGWTRGRSVRRRVNLHRRGKSRARLVMAAVSAGCALIVARTWKNATRDDERRLKNAGHAPRECPICRKALVEK